jgi:glycerol-1-phosphate dehydrogenase [NAD(P)+]
MNMIEESLKYTTQTKACEIAPGAAAGAYGMFRRLWPEASRAIVVDDANTKRVAGDAVIASLRAAGIDTAEYTLNPDGSFFHATYDKVDEVRSALSAAEGAVPVAVGSGTVNDLVKQASGELGRTYMIVGTAASMDGYTAANASITKDGMKQTLSCSAPLGCIIDTAIAAAAPAEMTASGYADLIAKIPAGADWLLADAIGSEAVHPEAWKFVQSPLRDTLSNPAGCAAGDEREVRKLCEGLAMSGFAMQAMDSSRPASGTEHQLSHYWDMEHLSFNGRPVSHGFKVGIGTLVSTKVLEFILREDIGSLDVDALVARAPRTFEEVSGTFAGIYSGRPDHLKRAMLEYAKKFSPPEALRAELLALKAAWSGLKPKLLGQLMPFDEVRAALKTVGAPVEPEEIGVSRRRLRETFAGVPYMRARYFGIDLVCRIGRFDALCDELFGSGGVWEC